MRRSRSPAAAASANALFFVAALAVRLCAASAAARGGRSWTECVPPTVTRTIDPFRPDGSSSPDGGGGGGGSSPPPAPGDTPSQVIGYSVHAESDPFRFTESPSTMPSTAPSTNPSDVPSSLPTSSPTDLPSTSLAPSVSPTVHPTQAPTDSPTVSPTTAKPTNKPTPTPIAASVFYPSYPEPPSNQRPSTYYNYDPASSRGPPKWDKVDVSKGTDNYWHEFELEYSPYENYCVQKGGSSYRQSPIDVCMPGGHCGEHHEMRARPGDFNIANDGNITKQILPNKLRLLYARRTGEEPDPPATDFAKNGAGLQDMMNIDFKFPSEHTYCGKRYDGELQYWHWHYRKRWVAVSWMLDASPGNRKNKHLQKAIDEFQAVFDDDMMQCYRNQWRHRTLLRGKRERKEEEVDAGAGTFGGDDAPSRNSNYTRSDDGASSNRASNAESSFSSKTSAFRELLTRTLRGLSPDDEQSRRRLKRKWNPFHRDIQRTVHFWAYKGSLTEPPCSPAVDWRLMDVPTLISPEQLAQLRHLLYAHRDPDCKYTSVHYDGGESNDRRRNLNGDDDKRDLQWWWGNQNEEEEEEEGVGGGVARPLISPQDHYWPYYKCSRQDYVSDMEMDKCGKRGCGPTRGGPYGRDLDPWYPPEFEVTAPPSASPTIDW